MCFISIWNIKSCAIISTLSLLILYTVPYHVGNLVLFILFLYIFLLLISFCIAWFGVLAVPTRCETNKVNDLIWSYLILFILVGMNSGLRPDFQTVGMNSCTLNKQRLCFYLADGSRICRRKVSTAKHNSSVKCKSLYRTPFKSCRKSCICMTWSRRCTPCVYLRTSRRLRTITIQQLK